MRTNKSWMVGVVVGIAVPSLWAAAPPGANFHTLTPCRVFDSTGVDAPPLAHAVPRTIQITGAECGVPFNASSVHFNMTVLNPTADGDLILYAADAPTPAPPRPGALPFKAGQTKAKSGVVSLSTAGAVNALATMSAGATVDLILDITGYFVDDQGPVAVDDSATVAEDAAATAIDVLVNDTDADGGPKAIASASDPANGTVVLTGGSPGAHTGLTYEPDPNYCNDPPGTTPDTFTYTLTPGGSIGTVEVTVDCVNDAPAGTDNTVDTPEDTDYVFTTADFGFTDPDDTPTPNALLAVKITTLPGDGSLTLSNVAVVAGQDIAVADITGGNLEFSPAAGESGTPYTSFTFQVQDDGGTAVGGVDLDPSANTMTIDVTGVNNEPAGADNTVATNEDTDYVFAEADFGFTDTGDTPPDVLEAVKITTLPAAGSLTLSAVAVVAGQDIPVADITAGNLKFTPVADANGAPYTTFTFQVQDDGGTAGGGVDLDQTPNTMTIDVNAVNDAPAGADNTVTTGEDVDYVFASADFGFTDPDDTPANALDAVRITTIPGAGSLTLSAVAVVAGQEIAETDITAGNLKFTPAAGASGAPYTTFTFQVRDDGGILNGGVDLDPSANTMTINVDDVNDAPAGADNTVSTNEETDYTFATADFGFSDPNDTPPNNFLAVTITTLPAAGVLELSNVAVTAGQSIPVAGIPNLTFTPAANGSGTPYTTFTFQVQDDGGIVNGGVDLDPSANTMTINVTALNDAPAGTDNTVATNEDSSYTFAAADFGFTDPNDTPADDFFAVRITTLPGAGTLALSAVPVVAGQDIPVAQIPNLVFTPAANANGSPYTSFTFQVQDDGGIANGGVDLDPTPNTMTINVNSVNDAPAGTDNTVTTDEDVQYTFTLADFGFTDPNDSPANSFASVIVSAPTAGSLTLTGEVTAAQITGNLLKFTPAANAFGSPYATFTFQVRDNGGVASGGVDLDPSANTMTVNVNPVNDAPTVIDETFHVIGNTELRVDMTAGTTPHASETTAGASVYEGVLDNDGDVEGDVVSVSAVGSGCGDATPPFDCTLASGAVVHVDGNGEFSFTPGPGDTSDSFQYTVTDVPAFGTALSANGTVSFTFFEMVWYVDNDAAAGNGTSSSPFNALSGTNLADTSSGDADLTDDLDDASDYIFVHFGDGTSTGLATGLQLEAGQHLIGEHSGLSIPVDLNSNGSPTVLHAGTPGSRPLLTNATGNAVFATDVVPVEIVGMSLSSTVAGTGNAIDWTTTGAFSGTGTLTIRDNVVTGATAEGVDVNLAGTGATGLAFHDNNLTATGTAVDIQETGTNALTISAFHDNVVSGNSAGAGIVVGTAVFDASATAGIQPVPGGTTVIGDAGNRIGGSGMALSGVSGALNFANAASGTIGAGDLDIFSDSGTALSVAGTGVFDFDVTPNAGVLVANAGAAAVIATADIDLQLNSLTSSNSAGTGVSLTTVTGTFSAPTGSSITNASGTDFVIASTSAAVTYGGTITDDVGQLVSVSSSGGSLKSFTGAITDGDDGDGGGISLTGNSSTIRFSGGLVLDTGATAAFAATGGGTVEVCDENPCSPGATGLAINKIETTTATALNVANTNIGANHLEFRSISSSGGGSSGIVLNATGASGGLKVKGNGGACTSAATCTGGAIINKTVDAVSLTSTSGTSLTRMFIDNSDNSGIRGDELTNFTLDTSTVTNNANVADGTEANLRFFDLLGTSTISSSKITGGFEDQIRISPFDSTGTLSISGTEIGNTVNAAGNGISISVSSGGDGNNDANFTLNVTTSNIHNIAATGIAAGGDDDFKRTVNVTSSDFTDNNTAIHLLGSEDADITFNIDDNDFIRHGLNPIQIVSGSTSTNQLQWMGKVNNNRIGNGTPNSGATDLAGIAVEFNGDVQAIVSITNNQVKNTDIDGIFIQTRLDNDADAETGRLDLTLRDNDVDTPDDNSAFPFFFVYGTRVEARNTTTICLDMAGNSSAGVGGAEHFQLRQRDTAIFRLERLTDGDGTPNELITNMATVEAHIIAQNDAGSTADATQANAGTGFTETADGTCLSPTN